MEIRIAMTALALAASMVTFSSTSSDASTLVSIVAEPSGVLNPIVDNGSGTSAKATANFTPISKGKATELQVLNIVDTAHPEDPPNWKKIAASTQDASGSTVFTLSNPLEVSHKYRAVSGATSNEVTYAAKAVTKNTGLSTIYVNVNDGHSVDTRTRWFDGEFSMTASSNYPECTASDPTKKKAQAKGRGNYSWSFAKKSFTLKLDKKQSLCGLGSSKKWALVANHYDKSLLRTAAAFNIGSKLTKLAWTPKARPVDLYVNGSYRGSYQLMERITVDPLRINVPELKNDTPETTAANNVQPNVSGGYILEWDFRKGADHNVTAGGRGYVGIKEPEDESDGSGITTTQVNYVNGYLDATDKALFGSNYKDNAKGWKKYIDINSAVDYYIGQELMKPVDGNMWASVYMYKQRDSAAGAGDGKLFFGPMWDYDLSSGSANRAGNTVGSTGWYLKDPLAISAKQSSTTWFNRLNDDPDFQNAVKARWNVVHSQLKTNDAFLGSQKNLITSSANANFKKWSVTEHLSSAQVVKGSWLLEVSYLRGWLNKRITWMDGQY